MTRRQHRQGRSPHGYLEHWQTRANILSDRYKLPRVGWLRSAGGRILLFALLFSLTASVGQAQSRTTDITSDIAQQIESLQWQLDQLKASRGMVSAEAASSTSSVESQFAGQRSYPPAAQAPVWCPRPNSKYPSVRVSGMFHADAAWFHQDAANIAAVGDIQDGADFRRARLAAIGDVWNNVGYMIEMDFAFPGRPTFMDVWLELREVAGGTVRIGQYRQPMGMDALTSVKELPFLERALPFAFLPFRQTGAMYSGHAENELATWAISGFRFPADPYGGNVGDNGGYGLATRLTGLLVDHGDDGILHMGGGYSFVDPSNDQIRYQSPPEFSVSQTGGGVVSPVITSVPPFVDTGAIPTRNVNLFNAELAASRGSFHAQSEVYYTRVNQIGGPDLTFSGAYAQAGYILTGEHRPYYRKAGVFGRVDPLSPWGQCGWGAWEVAGRWSYIDLNDQNIAGGRLNNVTFGVNWYLNRYTKFQFSYIHSFLGTSPEINPGPIVNDSNADIVAIRAHLDF